MATSSQDVTFELNGQTVTVTETGSSLLESLRDQLRVRSVKDGCSPQGQCGCCTVLVDGQPRVSCVTPTRRVAGRSITTIEGLAASDEWSEAFCAAGASQCGFCTPGIIVRLAGAETKHGRLDEALVRDAMKAHLCRCTGWQTIVEAAVSKPKRTSSDRSLAIQRADIEGGTPQAVGPMVARGEGGFADDSAPADALLAVRAATGEWIVAETLSEARRAAGKV